MYYIVLDEIGMTYLLVKLYCCSISNCMPNIKYYMTLTCLFSDLDLRRTCMTRGMAMAQEMVQAGASNVMT